MKRCVFIWCDNFQPLFDSRLGIHDVIQKTAICNRKTNSLCLASRQHELELTNLVTNLVHVFSSFCKKVLDNRTLPEIWT